MDAQYCTFALKYLIDFTKVRIVDFSYFGLKVRTDFDLMNFPMILLERETKSIDVSDLSPVIHRPCPMSDSSIY